MFILDGKVLQVDLPFTHGDLQYPATWLRTSTPEEKAAIGIIEIAEKIRPDDRFYWVDADNNGVPKDLNDLMTVWTSQVRVTAGTLLAPTDWYIVRQFETNDAPPAAVSEYRAAVRDYSNQLVAGIANVAVVEDLISLVTSLAWPQS